MPQPKPLKLAGFPKGMTNLGAPYALPEGACRNAVNVDFDDAGKSRLRKGSTLKYAAADCDSLWSDASITLFREGQYLKELLRDSAGVYTARTVRSGLTPGYRIAFLDVNGEVYWSNGITTGRIRAGVDGPWGVERPPRQPVLAAETVGGYPPSPGTGLELYNGRIYIAQGTVLWATDPYRYGLYRPHEKFFHFPDEIRMHAAVSDGLYVATAARTYFISGIDTEALRQREVLPYGAPAGAATRLPDTKGTGSIRIAFFSHRGWVIGQSGGVVTNLMEDRNAVAQFARAATLYREQGGLKQLIAIAQEGVAPAGQAKDYTDYEIARHGVGL